MPPVDDGLSPLLKRLGDVWATYFKGQLIAAGVIGGLTWVASAIIGLSYPGLLGIVAGVLETVPGLGPLVALVPAIAVALWKGSLLPVPRWALVLIVIAIYIAIQQLAAWVIEPHILGKRLRLPPLLVLFVVIVGAFLAGPLGAILAVPVLASLREIIRFLMTPRRPPES